MRLLVLLTALLASAPLSDAQHSRSSAGTTYTDKDFTSYEGDDFDGAAASLRARFSELRIEQRSLAGLCVGWRGCEES